MPGRDQAIDDRVHNLAVGSEDFAAGGRYLDSNPVVRPNQRAPRACHVGLMGDRKNERVGHPPDDLRVGLEIVDRVLVASPVNDRRRRRGGRRSGRREALGESGCAAERGGCAPDADD